MSDALIRKLEVAVPLTADDKLALEAFCKRFRQVEARQDLANEGDRPEHVHVILRGFACRYKVMPDGHRHIIALLVPGDLCDLHVAILNERDHSIATLSACTVVTIPRATILELTGKHLRVAKALSWATLVDESILREWLVNLTRLQAGQRIAHLFCELLLRLRAVGLADGNAFDFPLTQVELGDVLGLTSIHVNRTLQDLRAAELVVLKSRRLEILDPDRLMRFCDFNPNYLHLTPRR